MQRTDGLDHRRGMQRVQLRPSPAWQSGRGRWKSVRVGEQPAGPIIHLRSGQCDAGCDAAAERRRGYDHPQRNNTTTTGVKTPPSGQYATAAADRLAAGKAIKRLSDNEFSVAAGGGGGRADNAGHVSRSNASLHGTQMHGLSRPTSWHDRGGR